MPNLIVFYTFIVFKHEDELKSCTNFGSMTCNEEATWEEVKPVITQTHMQMLTEQHGISKEEMVYAHTAKLERPVFQQYIRHIAALN